MLVRAAAELRVMLEPHSMPPPACGAPARAPAEAAVSSDVAGISSSSAAYPMPLTGRTARELQIASILERAAPARGAVPVMQPSAVPAMSLGTLGGAALSQGHSAPAPAAPHAGAMVQSQGQVLRARPDPKLPGQGTSQTARATTGREGDWLQMLGPGPSNGRVPHTTPGHSQTVSPLVGQLSAAAPTPTAVPLPAIRQNPPRGSPPIAPQKPRDATWAPDRSQAARTEAVPTLAPGATPAPPTTLALAPVAGLRLPSTTSSTRAH